MTRPRPPTGMGFLSKEASSRATVNGQPANGTDSGTVTVRTTRVT